MIWDYFGLQKECRKMYSKEFMRYLINYQKPEYDEKVNKQVKYFRFGLKNRASALVFLLNKK